MKVIENNKLEKSSLVRFAEDELSKLEKFEDEMQEAMNEHILNMVQVFSEEGHSGFSAGYAINILNRLLRYLPLSAIEDNSEEWHECRDGVYQHKRCSRVFKDKNRFEGQAYDIEGCAFSDDGGKTWFSNGQCHVPIEFPYLVPMHPQRFLVDENRNIISEVK